MPPINCSKPMPMTYALFAYGTLQIPEVMQAVAGAGFLSQPARLAGYARYRIAGRPYPGLRMEPGAVTEGLLYRGMDAAALRRLDEFEDEFYRRETLPVLTASGVPAEAEVYVIPPEHYSMLADRTWDLEEFRNTALREFLARCRQRP
jgi:gamma-glutamylcyclotransferase (GGCT)/AIG2-like uncharacterized protein YtfP